MKLSFLGESNNRKIRTYLIESSKGSKILLDCGLPKNIINQKIISNYIIPDSMIRSIDGIFISHAHLDHWGYLSRLILRGYNNPIYMTNPTKDILKPAIDLFFKEVKIDLKYASAFSKMYNLIQTFDYGEHINLKDFDVVLLPANHILGSAQVLVEEKNLYKQVLYTSDFNPRESSLFNSIDIKSLNSKYNIDINPQAVIIETSNVDFKEEEYCKEEEIFITMVNETFKNLGNVLIPVKAIGDAQDFLTKYLDYIFQEKVKVPIPIYVIGTLLKVNKIYIKYKNEFRNPELVDLFDKYLCLKLFNDTLFNEYGNDWDLFFNKREDFGNKTFIATGGNLVGTAYRVYSYLKNASKNLIIKPKRFEDKNCVAKLVQLRMFSLHGNYNSMLQYINELEIKGKTFFFLVHGSYKNLKYFNTELNSKNISNKIPKIQESYKI